MKNRFWPGVAGDYGNAGIDPFPPVATSGVGPNKSSPERRYPGYVSNPGPRNCNLLACICVWFSTDRRWSPQLIKQALKYAGIGIACLTISPWFSGTSGAQERPTLLTLEELVEQTLR